MLDAFSWTVGLQQTGQTGIPLYSDIICGMRALFGAFKNLLKGTASCEENPYFYIYTEDKVYIYEIFSYYETKSTSDRFATFTSDASYDDYVQWATEHSLYASDADLSDRGNIVSLSTCYGSSGTKRRALIHGVLTETADY